MASTYNAPKPINKSKYPCGVCGKGVGSNSINCSSCSLWIHKRCTNIKGVLKQNPNFKCKKCRGEITTPNIPELGPVEIDGGQIEVAKSFCYLGDLLGQRGGCYDATTARIRSAWKKFRELLPILSCRGLWLKARGHGYNACVHRFMLHGSGTWPATKEDVTRLERNDMMMIRWICSAKLTDKIPSNELRDRMGLCSIQEILKCGRLRWYGHLQRMDPDMWPRKVLDMKVEGRNPRGRPRKTWMECVGNDMKEKGLKKEQTMNRYEWRRAIKPLSRHNKDGVQPSDTGNNAR